MSLKNVVISLALTLSLPVLAVNHGMYFQNQSLSMQKNPARAALKLRADGSMRGEEIGFFEQKLNHKSTSPVTFKQRYFIDSGYAEGDNAPVFYIICGEWNCAGTGSYSFVENLAKKFKGHLVALEHRFYGESLPTRKLTTQSLKTLNLESAIEDLKTFQLHLMKTRGLTGKWISAGGSYAGTLAAFYRLKHPELIAGSLASSAPVKMKNEFREYDAHIAKVVNATSCGDKVREAVKLIEDKLETPEGELEVKTLFSSTELKNNRDFLYVVADMLAAAVQYGRDKVFCERLNANTDLVKGYAQAGLTVLASMGSKPYQISLAVAENQDVTPNDNMRQWMWQSCREFGWFQVANGTGSETSRSSQIDLAYHQEICQRLYGVSMVRDGALNKEWYLPLLNPTTSNIIFSNGSNDPWLTLSITDGMNTNSSLDLFMMEGAAHCDDLKLMSRYPSVLAAHVEMEKIIKDWIK